jgi:hypothetical protein
MTDTATMTDYELAACADELHRRRSACRECGGDTKVWHVHICAEGGGVNLPLDHPLVASMFANSATRARASA